MSWRPLPFLPLVLAATSPSIAQTVSSGEPDPAASLPDCPGHPLCPSITANSTTTVAIGPTVAPDNSAPETDARGIPVISAPATAPAGYNQPAQTVPAGSPLATVAPPTPAGAGPLPPCTRTVTDRCTQTYERGRAR